jgi:restriction system protein
MRWVRRTSAASLAGFVKDRGLYVSTGGFTREARYEAERSSISVALVDLEDLAALIVEHYEAFDPDGRALVPLVKIYWPIAG